LVANVENLTLTGSGMIDGTGNNSNNVIIGNSASNTLSGGDGNDWLDGGDKLGGSGGVDTLIGGLGDGTYVVGQALVWNGASFVWVQDSVIENTGGGIDTVRSNVSIALPANVENIVLTGSDNIGATGSSGDNVLTGNSGNNTLLGGDGN